MFCAFYSLKTNRMQLFGLIQEVRGCGSEPSWPVPTFQNIWIMVRQKVCRLSKHVKNFNYFWKIKIIWFEQNNALHLYIWEYFVSAILTFLTQNSQMSFLTQRPNMYDLTQRPLMDDLTQRPHMHDMTWHRDHSCMTWHRDHSCTLGWSVEFFFDRTE